jgi:hypothetical protein
MPPVKTKVVDTAATSPAAFLSGAAAPEVLPATTAAAETAPLPTSAPEHPASEAPIPEVPAPNRPGLEVPPTPELAPTPDPFILLHAWGDKTKRTLRALPVPGGCVVRVSAAIPGNLSEAVCFVPGVIVVDGKLHRGDQA